jgi:mannose-6-phosphate isomerase-like protein (cupin superfamily)
MLEAVEAAARVGEISRRDCRTHARIRFHRDRMVEEYLGAYSRILTHNEREDHRPWGYYTILCDRPDHKVKRIVVLPGKRLSLQRHNRRGEFWTIVSGNPVVTKNHDEIRLKPGDSIEIPLGVRHRIANPGAEPVVLIEVQVGDYFGEDDIERFEDDFGREIRASRSDTRG